MQNVIVTGGNRGLGLGIARKLASKGYCVISVARKATDQLTAAITAVEEQQNGQLHFFAFDLAKTDEIPQLVKGVRKEYGPIYGLINNAGVGFDGNLALMPVAQIEELVRINTLAPIILTKFVVRAMMVDGGGRIVNISSITAFNGHSGLSAYSATKASLVGFTRSLAREIGKVGVNVNAVAPGFLDTDMTSKMQEDQRQRMMRRSPLGRLTEVDDVANAVEFLLGQESRSITGTVLTIDSGSTA